VVLRRIAEMCHEGESQRDLDGLLCFLIRPSAGSGATDGHAVSRTE
jgi:hypothetical protein